MAVDAIGAWDSFRQYQRTEVALIHVAGSCVSFLAAVVQALLLSMMRERTKQGVGLSEGLAESAERGKTVNPRITSARVGQKK